MYGIGHGYLFSVPKYFQEVSSLHIHFSFAVFVKLSSSCHWALAAYSTCSYSFWDGEFFDDQELPYKPDTVTSDNRYLGNFTHYSVFEMLLRCAFVLVYLLLLQLRILPFLPFKLHLVIWIYEADESQEEEIVQTNSIPKSYPTDGQILGSPSSLTSLLMSDHVCTLLLGLVHFATFLFQDFFPSSKKSLSLHLTQTIPWSDTLIVVTTDVSCNQWNCVINLV